MCYTNSSELRMTLECIAKAKLWLALFKDLEAWSRMQNLACSHDLRPEKVKRKQKRKRAVSTDDVPHVFNAFWNSDLKPKGANCELVFNLGQSHALIKTLLKYTRPKKL